MYTLLVVREISARDRWRFALFRFVPRLREHLRRANSELRDKDWVALRQSLQTIAGAVRHIPVSADDSAEVELLVKELGDAVGHDNRALPRATEKVLSKTARLLEDAEVRLQKFERISDG